MDGASVFITVQKVYYPLLCILGIPANLFTFYMICVRKCGMSETAIVYLSCLAVVDTLYLVWVILLDLTLTFLQPQPFWHAQPWCGMMAVMQYGALCSSSWVVVVFTIERYQVLSSAANARQRFARSRTTVLTCAAIVVLSHLVSVPMGWVNDVTPVPLADDSNGSNATVPRCRYREAAFSTALVWLITFLSGGIPIVLVILFNSLIACHLCRSSRLFTAEEHRAMRGAANTRGVVRRTVLILGTVSAAFVALSLPRFVTYCILRTQYNYKAFDRNDYGMPINVIGDVANMLQNLNSCTNFLLYCVVSRRFRQELVSTLTCRPVAATAQEFGSFVTQHTMKVFSILHNRRAVTETGHVVLTEHKRIE
ncbi:probable G-protein coupled receptor 139 [Engraulis encrasicolus]|uniref:probable G-protein coupled receptor 139 n=1 Tax=Engraulis encrasicolus TaxID=184585 RepID=UPI002FD42022